MTDQSRFRVKAEDAGQRLDRWLVRQYPDLGRRGARSLCTRGAVTMNGRRASKSDLLASGALVEVARGSPDRAVADPNLALVVLLERPDLVVVDKPAGLPSAALGQRPGMNLSSALLGRYPEMADLGYGPREAGLVHRLDTETSGVLVAARNSLAFAHLRDSLVRGEWDKRYLAVVHGAPPQTAGSIDRMLTPDPHRAARVIVVNSSTPIRGARPALTCWQLLTRAPPYSLLEVKVSRAVRHQIRAHLAWLGCPIAGDVLYGAPLCAPLGARHALHANYVAWGGDTAVVGFAAEAALPPAIAALVGG